MQKRRWRLVDQLHDESQLNASDLGNSIDVVLIWSMTSIASSPQQFVATVARLRAQSIHIYFHLERISTFNLTGRSFFDAIVALDSATASRQGMPETVDTQADLVHQIRSLRHRGMSTLRIARAIRVDPSKVQSVLINLDMAGPSTVMRSAAG